MRGHLLIEGTTARPALPDWHELTAALCGHIGDQPGDHPVTRAAMALALLHHARRIASEQTAVIDCGRDELIADIDEWISHAISTEHSTARPWGAAVDEMAEAQVHANHLLRTVADVSDERVHRAWIRLASLANRWTDLVNDIGYQRPALPRA